MNERGLMSVMPTIHALCRHVSRIPKKLPQTDTNNFLRVVTCSKDPLCLSLGRVRPPFYWTNFVGTQPHFSIESKVPQKSNMPPSPKQMKRVPKLTQAKPKIAPKINRKGAQAPCPELPWLPTATSFFWILLRIVVAGICTGVSTLRA